MAARHDLGEGSSPWLLPLVGLAAALALWMGGDEMRQRSLELERRQQAAAAQPVRLAGDLLDTTRRSAAEARAERRAIETALDSREPLELLQTRFLFDLRQRCQAAGVQSCVVRFSADANRPAAAAPAASAASAQRLADKASAEVTLEDLGLARARATVGGTFQARELLDFITTLDRDTARAWRINGLVVRANNFELDVEQIVRPPATTPGGGS
jgi:hypothetical protein